MHFPSRRLLHFRRKVLHVGDEVHHVLLGAEPAAGVRVSGIMRSHSMAATRCSDASHSSRDAVSGKLRNSRVWTGMKSTVKISFSLGSRMTRLLSEVVAAHVQQLERGPAQIERAFVVCHHRRA